MHRFLFRCPIPSSCPSLPSFVIFAVAPPEIDILAPFIENLHGYGERIERGGDWYLHACMHVWIL